jgi:hypothetical protein
MADNYGTTVDAFSRGAMVNGHTVAVLSINAVAVVAVRQSVLPVRDPTSLYQR